jgi:hypothetical protein
MSIFNLTLTWLSSERLLLHFFSVKVSCLMDTSYTWMTWLYKQLLGNLGPCWRDQVKWHTEDTRKRLARGTRKYFVTVNMNEEFFSVRSPHLLLLQWRQPQLWNELLLSTVCKAENLCRKWAVAAHCVQGRELVQEMFPVKIHCFSLKLNITQKHSTVFTWI